MTEDKKIEKTNFQRTWNNAIQLHRIDPRKKQVINWLAMSDVFVEFEKKLNEVIDKINREGEVIKPD